MANLMLLLILFFRCSFSIQSSASKIMLTSNTAPILPVLGTMTFADQTDITDAREQMKHFMSRGYRKVDTARMYAYGHSEDMLGKLLAENVDWREKLAIDSKVNPFKGYNENLSPENVKRQMGSILQALQTDSIQVLYLHSPGIAKSTRLSI